MRRVLGIDPGITGAFAIVSSHPDEPVQVFDMPTVEIQRNGKMRRELDVTAVLRWLRSIDVDAAYLEKVASRPGESPVAAFSFGRGVGMLEAALAACEIPMTTVMPAVWKRKLSVPAGKGGARARASQLIPSGAAHWTRVKDDGRAEAAMIALYGLMHQGT